MYFRDKYSFLSNFYPCDIKVDIYGYEITFKCVESAFQAFKQPELMKEFIHLEGKESKSKGRKVQLREDWNDIKVDIMRKLLNIKFSNKELQEQLLSIEGEIVETNLWGDTFWGKSRGVGENHLGILLMEIREKLKNGEPLLDNSVVDLIPFEERTELLLDYALDGGFYYRYEELKETSELEARKLLENHYSLFSDIFDYFEFNYSRFITRFNLNVDPLVLYEYGVMLKNEHNELAKDVFKLFLLSLNFVEEDRYDVYNFDDYPVALEYIDSFLETVFPDFMVIYPRATLYTGNYFLDKKDYVKAFKCFKAGAEINYDGRQSCYPFAKVADNKYELARLYETGNGVDQDYVKAVQLYNEVAEYYGRDNISDLARMYLYGKGVDQDYQIAAYKYLFGWDNKRFPYSNYFIPDSNHLLGDNYPEEMKLLYNYFLTKKERNSVDDAFLGLLTYYKVVPEADKVDMVALLKSAISDYEKSTIYVDEFDYEEVINHCRSIIEEIDKKS